MDQKANNQYWNSLEQLYQDPHFMETVDQEFVTKPEDAQKKGMERRTFLKLMGASMLMASVAGCRRPVEKVIPYVNKPLEITPGVPSWYASTCQECSASCGLLVKTREARPIKLEGNPEHPINQGALCSRGQAGLLDLYSPVRLRAPQFMDRATQKGQETTWDICDEQIKQALGAVNFNQKVYFLTGAQSSPSTRQLIQDYLKQFSNAFHVVCDPLLPRSVVAAQKESYGQNRVPRYRFEKADYILSFGADFLSTYLSPVEYAKGFSKKRRVSAGEMSRLVCVESSVSLTGMNADERVALRSGDELLFALAVAHELLIVKKKSSYASQSAITRALDVYAPDVTARKLGVDVNLIQKVANELWSHRSKGLVLGGSLHGAHSFELEIVVNLLNSILDNDGTTIDWALAPDVSSDDDFADLLRMIEDMQKGEVAAVFIQGCNPAFQLPSSMKFAEALQKVPLVVNFSKFLDETALVSTHLCPEHHTLENWSDAQPQNKLYSLVQPVIAPLYQTRAFQDSLLSWKEMNVASWYDYLRSYWAKTVMADVGVSGSFDAFWNEALEKGLADGRRVQGNEPQRVAAGRSFKAMALKELAQVEYLPQGQAALNLYVNASISDGRHAHNPWLQELPDPVSKVTWDNYLAISPNTAKTQGLRQGDIVAVEVAGETVELPVLVQPMLHDQTYSVALGYGRWQVGHSEKSFGYEGLDIGVVGQKTGVNVQGLQQVGKQSLVWGGLAVSQFKNTGKKYRLATTQSHHTMAGRNIVKETTFKEFQSNPAAGNEEHHSEKTLWAKHEYKGYRWGMAIDTNSCIGCASCMVGCQSENNIPVVGKEQVLMGRDMHWIRVDRYYKGEATQPEASFQPMLCQHCENAPCETVCPVLATVHSSDGLNQMIYNRCVGTRYCANNCPYKVRRFNFFEYSQQYEKPLNLLLNPDSTVRSQGVMEKCSFCVQRIRVAKSEAKEKHPPKTKDEVSPIEDGTLKTACQQTCPTDAIVFGNLNDPESAVSKLVHSKRGYHVLADLNVVPQVTYLTKVRNKNA